MFTKNVFNLNYSNIIMPITKLFLKQIFEVIFEEFAVDCVANWGKSVRIYNSKQ